MLAASHADLIYSCHGSLEAGQAFYADVKRRLTKYGRSPDALKILPGANFVIGDTQADAQENESNPSSAGQPEECDRLSGAGLEPGSFEL
ncbi:LLM class flavin-dependent oxidoreductase [Rhizobium acidisoli]|uniref:LLM class flavin-dependent oxidoreductase n=1 Tax=Rhizobium acidisoli TaxID=1538158 RepID=UPI000B1D43EB|nr:LLM class flavin-dependent oxidoreductase [Rhizobium acidisoli]